MLGTFPKDFCQVETSQMCNIPKRQFPKSVLAAALGPHCSLRRLRGPNLWEVTAWEIAHLGSFHLGNTLENLPLGKNPL